MLALRAVRAGRTSSEPRVRTTSYIVHACAYVCVYVWMYGCMYVCIAHMPFVYPWFSS